MILSKTPLRITLGGGGTDSPDFVKEHGGYAITAAFKQYVTIAISDPFEPGYLLRYSQTEHVQTLDEIQHPIMREALRLYDIPPHVEIVTTADIPAGTGLGSSGAFTVGLCMALAAYKGKTLTQEMAAENAAAIELGLLQRPGGQQDHWACALGGVQALSFERDGFVKSTPLILGSRLDEWFSLFFTGYSRDADTILSTQTQAGLAAIKESATAAFRYLCRAELRKYGEQMHEHWLAKKARSPQMSNPDIDYWYTMGMYAGAFGGKLVGAGGGGFLLFVTEDRERLSKTMAALGLKEVPVEFDHTGTTIL